MGEIDNSRLIKFYNLLKEPFTSRDIEAHAIVLALLSGEHVILLGEPGTAKSALAKRAASLLKARYFQYLMTKYTEPNEIFGPLDVIALRRGEYRRIIQGKLPSAEIVFLDEIFKANSAILNTLLTILNERVFYDYYGEIRVPLWTCIGASNEVPSETELQTFYDRFLIRHLVKPVDETMWPSLLRKGLAIERYGVWGEPVLTLNEIKEYSNLIYKVNLEHAIPFITKMFSVLEEHGLHLSDRRKVKSLKIIAANAIFNGRLHVEKEDLETLRFIVPHNIEDFEKVSVILIEELKLKERYKYIIEEAMRNLRQIEERIDKNIITSAEELREMLMGIHRTERTLREAKDRIGDYELSKRMDEILEYTSKLLRKIESKLGEEH